MSEEDNEPVKEKALPLWVKPSYLPDKVRLCVLDERGKPLRGVPVQLVFEVFGANIGEFCVTLGVLASNHVGYLAFDIRRNAARLGDAVVSVRAVVPMPPAVHLDLSEKLLRPLIAGSAASTRPDIREVIPFLVPGVLADTHAASRGLNSIEAPDISDWLLSPGSFGVNAVSIIGESGCEELLPSHAAERIVRFNQLVRTPSSVEFPSIPFRPVLSYDDEPPAPEPGWPGQLYYRTGELRHYELVWVPINHGLGKVLYSLTLAPCEAVRLAVLDWSRDEVAQRAEQVGLSDELTHSLRRDRSVEEVVNAVLRERQSGESFLGGMAGVGGYGGGMGGGGMGTPPGGDSAGSPGGTGTSSSGASGGGQQAGQNWGVTGSHSLGYAMASSSGNRDVDVETTQNLIDEIAQASHLVRDLRSTVVVQASQVERETIQTRIVRNHNHSHALTILYYEVVRHYWLRAFRRRVQPVVFVRYPRLVFADRPETRNLLIKHKEVLRAALKDHRLATGFEALEQLERDRRELARQSDARVRQLMLSVHTGGSRGGDDRVGTYLVSDDGLLRVMPYQQPQIRFGNWGKFREGSRNVLFFNVYYDAGDVLRPIDLPLASLHGFGLAWNAEEMVTRWQINSLHIAALVDYPDGGRWLDLYRSTEQPALDFPNDSDVVIPLSVPDTNLLRARIAEKEAAVQELLAHLDMHRTFYGNLIWLNESANERAARFEHYSFDLMPLIERIENRPIDVVGEYVVFPLATREDSPETRVGELLSERIISLPTRGAFAEAKLSHCNASEVIDETRFWDWQQSPCPDEPTDIMPIGAGSRRSTLDLASQPLPPSGAGISDPQAAPEPFGMREVMQLLRTPEVFRDMSGIDQLGPLLQKLVEVAGEVEKARIGATTALATVARGTAAESRVSPPSAAGSEVAATRGRSSAAQVAQRQIRQAQAQGLISGEQASDLTYRTLDGLFANGAGGSDFSEEPAVRQLIQSAVSRGRDVELRQGDDFIQVRRSTGPGGILSGSDVPDPSSPFWGPLPRSDRWYQGWLLLYNFDIDAIDLKSPHQRGLDRLTQTLDLMEAYRIEAVQGRASETGGEDQNQWLSAGRGEAVVQYLVDRGVPAEQIPSLPSPPLGSGRPIRVVPTVPEDPVNRSVLIIFHVLVPSSQIPVPIVPASMPGLTSSLDWAIRVVLSSAVHDTAGVSVLDVHIKNCGTGEVNSFGLVGLGIGLGVNFAVDLGGWTSFRTVYPVTFRQFDGAFGFYYTLGFDAGPFGIGQAYLRLPYLVEGAIDLGGYSVGASLEVEGGGYIDLVELMATGTRYRDDVPCP